MNQLAKTLSSFQVIGKRQTIVTTKDVQVSVQKVSASSELVNLSISTAPHDTEGSRVEMPMTFLNDSDLGSITVTVSTLNNHNNNKANLERKRCANGHENDDFDTTTDGLYVKAFLWLKRLWCKKLTFYVLDLVYLTSLSIHNVMYDHDIILLWKRYTG